MANSKNIKDYLTSQNLLIGIIALVFISLVVLIGRSVIQKDKSVPITKDQIMIQKGGNTVIVNKNGLIEYRSGSDVFYRTWGMDRINSFFTSMEIKAREYLANPPPEGQVCQYYTVTLYVDGNIVTVCVEGDEDLDEIYEEYDDNDDGDDSLSDYFDDDDDDDNGGGGSSSTSPTPTPIGGSSSTSPTPTPIGGGGGGDDGVVPTPPQSACERWATSIIDKAVISNILCTSGDGE